MAIKRRNHEKLIKHLIPFFMLLLLMTAFFLNKPILCSIVGIDKDTREREELYYTSPQQVYILGDSLTTGFGSSGSNVVGKLSSMLGPLWEVRSRGVGGNTTAQMLVRLNKDIISARNARYVVVWGGINDIYQGVESEDTKNNLQEIYTALHYEGIKVVAVNISPSKLSPTWSEDKQFVTDEINKWIANSAKNVDYKVDIFEALENPSKENSILPIYNGGDYLHLSEAGYYRVGKSIYESVTWSY